MISSQGASRELLRQCLLLKYQPLMGNALFSEYEQVTGRDEILRLCSLSIEEIETLLASFMSVCEWMRIYYLWRPNLIDEADNHLIELAIAGNTSIIVTHNTKDFKQAQLSFPELLILKPEEVINLN
ncbi:PIN domain-containing protein [Gloeocapsopsis crepidinum LEGE 06123]|uniref:PIN domain-containing protein n=1 Tax=Gloeocapsopsis crepidinum LEGE 06123 TaxID=588587 RepID=A0ABR9UKH0_9CHRO|nr:PIN domain-containing protein [Gloeocapsopsis crepidinum]MBE9188790.1 PIN domain-containing protein [Gloeocapsopsis crepidinum LEGE 06123]